MEGLSFHGGLFIKTGIKQRDRVRIKTVWVFMTVLNVPAQHTVTLSKHTHEGVCHNPRQLHSLFYCTESSRGGTSRTIDSILSCICALWEGGMVARIEKKETLGR